MKADINELKKQIIEVLNLEGMKPEDIGDDEPLFGDEGVGLDSIDALELIVILEKNYGIKIQDPNKAKGILQSVQTMAAYINENSPE